MMKSAILSANMTYYHTEIITSQNTTHARVWRPFFRAYPGEPVPER